MIAQGHQDSLSRGPAIGRSMGMGPNKGHCSVETSSRAFWKSVSRSIRLGNAGRPFVPTLLCPGGVLSDEHGMHLPTTMRRQENFRGSDTHSGFVDPQNNPRLATFHSLTPTHPFRAQEAHPTHSNQLSSLPVTLASGRYGKRS